jgi:hypothetical protein
METRKHLFTALCLTLLSGCGGSGSSDAPSSSSGPSTPSSASAGGIWRGTESVSGLQVIGLVDEAGELHFLRSDNVQYVGNASVSGTSVSANVEGFVPVGFAFPDGSTHGTGTVSGTIQARASINLNTHFTTDAGNASAGTLNLTFDTLYNRPSALATIAGNFTNPQNGAVVSVNSDGTLFSQDPASGCVVNGAVLIINASYNAYRVQFSYASCTGQAAVLNGIQFSGLGTLENTVSPERAIIGVTGQSATTKYAVVLSLNRS